MKILQGILNSCVLLTDRRIIYMYLIFFFSFFWIDINVLGQQPHIDMKIFCPGLSWNTCRRHFFLVFFFFAPICHMQNFKWNWVSKLRRYFAIINCDRAQWTQHISNWKLYPYWDDVHHNCWSWQAGFSFYNRLIHAIHGHMCTPMHLIGWGENNEGIDSTTFESTTRR